MTIDDNEPGERVKDGPAIVRGEPEKQKTVTTEWRIVAWVIIIFVVLGFLVYRYSFPYAFLPAKPTEVVVTHPNDSSAYASHEEVKAVADAVTASNLRQTKLKEDLVYPLTRRLDSFDPTKYATTNDMKLLSDRMTHIKEGLVYPLQNRVNGIGPTSGAGWSTVLGDRLTNMKEQLVYPLQNRVAGLEGQVKADETDVKDFKTKTSDQIAKLDTKVAGVTSTKPAAPKTQRSKYCTGWQEAHCIPPPPIVYPRHR